MSEDPQWSRGGMGVNSREEHLYVFTPWDPPTHRHPFIEEMAMHEAVHIRDNALGLRTHAWRRAQRADSIFVTRYAQNYPDREDMADTMWAWFVTRCVPERVNPWYLWAIETVIPARLTILDAMELDMAPYRVRPGWAVRIPRPLPTDR